MNREQIITEYSRINRQYEDRYLIPVQHAIHEMTSAVMEKLSNSGYDAVYSWLHTNPGNPAMATAIQGLYTAVGGKHARLTYSRLLQDSRKRKADTMQLETKGFGFNATWVKYILDYLKRHLLDKITFQVAETTRDALIHALNEGIKEGLGIDRMVDLLKDWPYERFQAARIVRTEVNRAANVGNKAQAATADWQQVKTWIAVHDFRTRGQNPKDHASHIGLDGTRIDEDDSFVDPRNGDRLLFPGDPQASAASVCNCRCVAAYEWKRDLNGNLIPKRRHTSVIFPSQQRTTVTVTI